MNENALFIMGKLTGPGRVLAASKHNKRAIQAEMGAIGSIDASRSHLNETLHGPSTPNEVAQRAKALMSGAGIERLKKSAVLALEIIFSLPSGTSIMLEPYFRDCLKWAAQTFTGIDNVLSADIHLDETAPHMHVLLLPLRNGRMQGSALMGNRQRLADLHSDFHAAVAGRYGLAKRRPRLQGQARARAAQAVLRTLRERNDSALQSAVWTDLRISIERDPSPFMQALGIAMPEPTPKRMRTMTEIFTSKGKGSNVREKPIGFPVRPNPIENADKRPASSGHLSCVGNAPHPALATGAQPDVIALHDGESDLDERVVDRSDCEFAGWGDE